MAIFLTMLELHLSGLKSILFYPEDQKMFLCGFFCSKEQMRKRSIFWEIPWTNPFAKCRFFRLFRTSLFRSKKYSFLSRIWKNLSFWLFWLKKKKRKKGRFFDKNHGLTPLQNGDFFRLCENFTFEVQRNFFFYPEYQKLFLYGFFAGKESYQKNVNFLTKPWTIPFAKCRFF